jgi:hypothetical protein
LIEAVGSSGLIVFVVIDKDVVAWLRSQGDGGYQTRLNEVLREAMIASLCGGAKKLRGSR